MGERENEPGGVRLGAIRAGWPDCVVVMDGDWQDTPGTPKRMCRGVRFGKGILRLSRIWSLEG
jgi:hypothetical protein